MCSRCKRMNCLHSSQIASSAILSPPERSKTNVLIGTTTFIPLVCGNSFQDAQQMPEAKHSTEVYIHCFLPYIHSYNFRCLNRAQ